MSLPHKSNSTQNNELEKKDSLEKSEFKENNTRVKPNKMRKREKGNLFGASLKFTLNLTTTTITNTKSNKKKKVQINKFFLFVKKKAKSNLETNKPRVLS